MKQMVWYCNLWYGRYCLKLWRSADRLLISSKVKKVVCMKSEMHECMSLSSWSVWNWMKNIQIYRSWLMTNRTLLGKLIFALCLPFHTDWLMFVHFHLTCLLWTALEIQITWHVDNLRIWNFWNYDTGTHHLHRLKAEYTFEEKCLKLVASKYITKSRTWIT